MKNVFLILILIFITFLLIIEVAESALTVTCEAGGPYAKDSIITIVGNVTNGTGTVANVSANITKGSTLEVSKSTVSGSDGDYFFTVTEINDLGKHSVLVKANRSSAVASCTDSFLMKPSKPSFSCSSKNVTVEGTAVYAETGGLVSSASLAVAVEGVPTQNKTTITNSRFTLQYSSCLLLAQRYILTFFGDDLAGRKGTAKIIFATT